MDCWLLAIGIVFCWIVLPLVWMTLGAGALTGNVLIVADLLGMLGCE